MAARVELFEAIRTDWRREQLSVRALAERHQVRRRTVRQALSLEQTSIRLPPDWNS